MPGLGPIQLIKPEGSEKRKGRKRKEMRVKLDKK